MIGPGLGLNYGLDWGPDRFMVRAMTVIYLGFGLRLHLEL